MHGESMCIVKTANQGPCLLFNLMDLVSSPTIAVFRYPKQATATFARLRWLLRVSENGTFYSGGPCVYRRTGRLDIYRLQPAGEYVSRALKLHIIHCADDILSKWAMAAADTKSTRINLRIKSIQFNSIQICLKILS